MTDKDEFSLKSLSGSDTPPKTQTKRRSSSPRSTGRSPQEEPKQFSKVIKKMDRRRDSGRFSPMVKKPNKPMPPIADGDVRVVTLGGVEEVGRNMFAVETINDLYIFDVGFEFTDAIATPGVDYSLPNTTYLEERRHKISGIVITHGHLDHIGGIPFLIERLGNAPIYTRELTSLMIQKRMEEFPNSPKLNMHVVTDHSHHKIGGHEFYFFPVSHSIPDCIAISMRTPHGNIIITGDVKLEHVDTVPTEEEESQWAQVGKENNLLLISDSTNCENTGWSLPEPIIHKTVAEIIAHAPSRVIIACFASHFRRMIAFVKTAEELGKKVVLEGRSVKINLELARLAGYFNPQTGTIIPSSDMKEYAPDKIIVLCTGGQGEYFAALPRMARNDHPELSLNERDTVVFSSSVIPGNENQVRTLMDLLARRDCRVVHYKTDDVHSTGHGNAEECKWIINKVNPKWFVPAYGYHSMLKNHRKLAIECGMERDKTIVPDDGSVIEISSPENVKVLEAVAPSAPYMVDGFSVSDLNRTIISDRQILSNDGIFVIVVTINVAQKALQKSPDIISRGFVYLRESQTLLSQTRGIIRKIAESEIKKTKGGKIEVERLKKDLSKQIGRHLQRETNKQPMVIPVILVI